ncbi:MAG: HEPN domain-containing protein [Nitrososphaeria archaeon]|nr:HEPN domain-containing protein [Nitrososphaeria archaeon]
MMLDSLPDKFKPESGLIDKAKELDRHYILIRYPNFHLEGTPMDHYTGDDALEVIRYAREVIVF